MNIKQEQFCKEYVKTGDVKKASENTGYSINTGRKLLKDDNIASYIEKLRENKQASKSEEVIECLTSIMRGECAKEGEAKAITIKDRLKAAELLGKVYCIFSPKQDSLNDEGVLIVGSDAIKE